MNNKVRVAKDRTDLDSKSTRVKLNSLTIVSGLSYGVRERVVFFYQGQQVRAQQATQQKNTVENA